MTQEPSIIYGLRLPTSTEYRYIGQTSMPERRMYLHRWNAGRPQPKLPVHKWMKKHGADIITMDTLVEVETGNRDALNAAEVFHVQSARDRGDRLLNITNGGDGMSGYAPSPQQRAAHSERMTGAGNPRFGATWSPDLRAKIISRLPDQSGVNSPRFGKKNSEEHRRRISENHHDVNGENNPYFGREHSEDARARMREGHAARSAAAKEESSRKMRAAAAGLSPEQRQAIKSKAAETRARNQSTRQKERTSA